MKSICCILYGFDRKKPTCDILNFNEFNKTSVESPPTDQFSLAHIVSNRKNVKMREKKTKIKTKNKQ